MSCSTVVTFPPVTTFFQTVQSHLYIYDCSFYSIAASSQTRTEGCVYWIYNLFKSGTYHLDSDTTLGNSVTIIIIPYIHKPIIIVISILGVVVIYL